MLPTQGVATGPMLCGRWAAHLAAVFRDHIADPGAVRERLEDAHYVIHMPEVRVAGQELRVLGTTREPASRKMQGGEEALGHMRGAAAADALD